MFEYMATVLKVTDADTLDLNLDLGISVRVKIKRCRLYGIDAPEMSTPEGKAAREFVLQQISVGDEIRVRTIKANKNVERTEKYGGYLVNVFCHPGEPDRCLNTELVGTGHAKAYFGGARD